MKSNRVKKLRKWTFRVLILLIIGVWLSDLRVNAVSKNKTYNDLNAIPHNKVGLVLGTSKYVSKGGINLYYKYRINATVELYQSGKIDYILVSGDNSTRTYDEPTTFKNDLIKAGIPSNKIYLDYAGFRTLDSVVRSQTIFGQESITIISQKFHNERAICIAQHFGLSAVGYNAKDVSGKFSLKVQIREKLARVKLFIDFFVGKSPKFGGDKIVIG